MWLPHALHMHNAKATSAKHLPATTFPLPLHVGVGFFHGFHILLRLCRHAAAPMVQLPFPQRKLRRTHRLRTWPIKANICKRNNQQKAFGALLPWKFWPSARLSLAWAQPKCLKFILVGCLLVTTPTRTKGESGLLLVSMVRVSRWVEQKNQWVESHTAQGIGRPILKQMWVL